MKTIWQHSGRSNHLINYLLYVLFLPLEMWLKLKNMLKGAVFDRYLQHFKFWYLNWFKNKSPALEDTMVGSGLTFVCSVFNLKKRNANFFSWHLDVKLLYLYSAWFSSFWLLLVGPEAQRLQRDCGAVKMFETLRQLQPDYRNTDVECWGKTLYT